MARLFGSRTINPKRKTPSISRVELEAFKDSGRKVTEKPDGTVLLDGFRKFRVTGGGKTKPDKKDVEPRNELTDFTGGPETETDFGVNVRGRRNELTEFV